jgi:hypothetical protein
MRAQEAWRLNEFEVELVASSRFRSGSDVAVVSIVCNYGAPIPRRTDDDFLDVWAAVDESLNPRSIALYGCGTINEDPAVANWRDIGEFSKSKTADINGRSMGLYHFSGPPVAEFVVRLTDHRGDYHYDNNGGYGVNYRLRRWYGFQVNCVRAAMQDHRDWILIFPRVVGIGSSGTPSVGFVEW